MNLSENNMTQSNPKGPFRELQFIRPALGHIYKLLLVMVVLTLVSAGVALLSPYFSKQVFDEGIIPKDEGKIWLYSLLVLSTFFISSILQFAAQAVYSIASNRFSLELKSQTLRRLLNMPFEFFDKRQTGYLVSRVNEADSMSGLFSPAIFQFLSSLIQGIGALIIILRMSTTMTLVLLPFLLVFYFIMRWMNSQLRKSTEDLRENYALSMGGVQETVSAVADIKQLTIEDTRSADIIKQFGVVAKNRVRQAIVMATGTSSIGFLSSGAGVAVMLVAGIAIARDQLSVGDYVALSAYSMKLLVPVQLFGTVSMTFQPLIVGIRRLGLIFNNKTEQEIWGHTKVQRLEGGIEFKDVSFGYDPEKAKVLHQCTFSISPGECIAIYGRNGVGKSTLFKLLLGFYPDYDGEILIDNMELHKYEQSALRQRLGIVSQNLLLFTGSLKDNIKMAVPEASEDSVKKVLTLSGCEVMFNGKVDEVQVLELGRNLSGGQKQATAIARCMLKDPDLLLFDEATAHLDARTRQVVMRAIKDVFASKTRILITQDRETASIADRVFLLELGTVKEIKKSEIP